MNRTGMWRKNRRIATTVLLSLISCGRSLHAQGIGLPTKFDLRDVEGVNYVSSVKNQGYYGTCWAHAIMAAIEGNVLVRDAWDGWDAWGEPNFAEFHLDWWNGFNTYYNEDVYPEESGLVVHWGGDYRIGAAYLSRLEGVVFSPDANDETEYDRNWLLVPPFLHDAEYQMYYVRDIEWYVLGQGLDHIDVIKRKIQANGVMGTCIFSESGFITSYIHYQPGSDTNDPNHAVAIVGWDDDKATQAAEGPGAWLVKNSWGSGWGEDGYFWISYYDKHSCRHPEMGAASFQNIESIQYTGVYYHDYHGWRATKEDCSEAFNAFVAERCEFLRSVSFYTAADSVMYEVRIYDRFEDGELLDERAYLSGDIAHTGFHTVDLTDDLYVRPGDDFYVYLWLSEGGQPLDRTAEVEVLLGALQRGTIVESRARKGESYYWDGSMWQDLTDHEPTANFCMKALTVGDACADCTIEAHDLFVNFPNPFNESTTIHYEISEASRVVLKIYNVLGQEVVTLVDEVEQPGRKWMMWDGRDRFGRALISGVYLCRLQVSDRVFTKKTLLVR